ncbi:MAG: lipocalin family protein [Bacteroides sp.]|nr:lipocalin family protein [Bacteroides sp.]
MKTLFGVMAMFMLMFGFTSCSEDDEEVTVPALEVNYVNVNGTWKLTEWNGNPIPENVYCYIVFKRKDHTFKMYQKFDSMYARCITGEFVIEQDEYWGSMISGTYDYGMGNWNNTYIVTDLLETGSMIWTVKGDDTDISKYERCDEVPAGVMAEAQSTNE